MTSEEATNRAIDGMVARLGRAPDLLLVHWPGRSKAAPESDAHAEARKTTWRCMENALRNHKCRAIGTSNYEIAHMRELLSYCDVPPAVNQIEIHPAYPNAELRAYCASLVPRVHTVGYSPLGVGELLDHPSVRAFADAIGLAPAPALIRWTLSNDCSVVVKSSSRAHTEENFTALSGSHAHRRRYHRTSRRRPRARVLEPSQKVLLGSARRALIDDVDALAGARRRDRTLRRAHARTCLPKIQAKTSTPFSTASPPLARSARRDRSAQTRRRPGKSSSGNCAGTRRATDSPRRIISGA